MIAKGQHSLIILNYFYLHIKSLGNDDIVLGVCKSDLTGM